MLLLVSGLVLVIIFLLTDDESPVVRLWLLRVFSAVFLGALLKIALFAGYPWDIPVIFFVAWCAIVYPLLCIPKDFWEALPDKLDRLWNSAEYARMEREEAQLRTEREAHHREQKAIRQQEVFDRRTADRKREAEEAKQWQVEKERRKAIRLKNETAKNALAEKKERERKADIIRDLKKGKDDGIPDF